MSCIRFPARRKPDYQLGIAKYRDVGIMCGKNELALTFFLTDSGYYTLSNETIIEIIFRLIYNQRRFRLQEQE